MMVREAEREGEGTGESSWLCPRPGCGSDLWELRSWWREIPTDSFPMLIGLTPGAVGTKEEFKLFVSDLRPSPTSSDPIVFVERYFKESFLTTTQLLWMWIK